MTRAVHDHRPIEREVLEARRVHAAKLLAHTVTSEKHQRRAVELSHLSALVLLPVGRLVDWIDLGGLETVELDVRRLLNRKHSQVGLAEGVADANKLARDTVAVLFGPRSLAH